MRTIIILLAVSFVGIITLSSCRGNKKKTREKITTEDRQVGAFTTVTIEGLFPVELTQTGEKESVKVEAEESLQHKILVTTEGNELIIKTEEGDVTDKSSKTKVYINVKDLTELDFKSVGSLTTVGTLKLDSLNLNTESVGKLILNLDAQFLHANLSSVGSTTLTGKVRQARINNKSVGTLSAFDLKAGTIMIHNTSMGITEVYADSAFYIRSSSVGALYYKGPGQVKELKSEGIGVVQKRD